MMTHSNTSLLLSTMVHWGLKVHMKISVLCTSNEKSFSEEFCQANFQNDILRQHIALPKIIYTCLKNTRKTLKILYTCLKKYKEKPWKIWVIFFS